MIEPLEAVADEAIHGSYCPKMCNFSCPVLTATGDERAAPWALHTVVAGIATGDRTADVVAYDDLYGCTGCHACQVACLYDLDVPAEVRAARAEVIAAGAEAPAVTAAARHVRAGRSPYGDVPAALPASRTDADVAVIAGCRDEPPTLQAIDQLLAAAGVAASWVRPSGCCGATPADLGDAATADACSEQLAARLRDAPPTVLATDPHCLPALRAVAGERTVRDVCSELAGHAHRGGLRLRGLGAVTYHDPCVLARDEGVTEPPRTLLAAAGADVIEPPGAARATACSGAGLALELVAPDAAGAVARRRTAQLADDHPVVTACARARRLLAAAGLAVRDLFVVLADHVDAEEPR
ncbi:MAG: (Fe-S)-binding protein [Actinomycetota bacterium]|nr:(Fe-S)-binding protein [Actinomycetota bacterium]